MVSLCQVCDICYARECFCIRLEIGAATGIKFYLKPNWSKIREFDVIGKHPMIYMLTFILFKVWIAAASQVTFSLSVAFGSILGYASFNKFKSNYLRYDAD